MNIPQLRVCFLKHETAAAVFLQHPHHTEAVVALYYESQTAAMLVPLPRTWAQSPESQCWGAAEALARPGISKSADEPPEGAGKVCTHLPRPGILLGYKNPSPPTPFFFRY